MRFVSDNSYYRVECPDVMGAEAAAYVCRVERYLPVLEETFGLEPRWPFGDLVVRFEGAGPCCEHAGLIKLPADLDLADPQNLYGGLFHETVHALLDGYLRLPDGRRHYLPEAATVVLQVAALERLEDPEARAWARRFAGGWGCTQKQRPILHELVRVYREEGFAPIRSIYAEMAGAICPAFHKETLVCDLNRVLRKSGVENLIRL